MKFITILIICLIYLFKFNEALALKPAQLTPAQSIIQTLYGTQNYADPCTYPGNLFTCSASGTENVITAISITSGSGSITNSFEAFVDVISITVSSSVSVPAIWTNINLLTKLQSLSIGMQSTAFPANVILPTTGKNYEITFVNIKVAIPVSFFASGDMYSLNIQNSSPGFSLPATLLTVNTNFQVLQIPVNSAYSSLPKNMNTHWTALTDIYLSVYNDKNVAGYATTLPTFDTPFTSLNNMAIYFMYDTETNLQTYTIPDSIINIGSASYLGIYGKGFNLPSSKTINFSNYRDSTWFDFENIGFLDQCISTPCLTFPVNTELTSTGNNINVAFMDFTNMSITRISGNQLSQPLPNPSSLDFSKTNMLMLVSSLFTGTIPSSYCNLNANSYRLYDNSLTGVVPTCFSCVGANMDGTNFLFGPANTNSFTGFTSTSTPTSCLTYTMGDIPSSAVIRTNQNTIITISGTDFGWSSQISATPSPAPTVSILVPNSKITLTIPKGDGTNKQLSVKFGGNYQFTKTFTYSYEAPVLVSKYYWTTLSGNNVFTLIGTGFSYINSNIIIINGNQYTVPIAVTSTIDPSKDQINLPFSATSSFSPGNSLVVAVKVAGQTSNTVNFIYTTPISMVTKDLYSIGGSNTFDGVFGVSNNVGVKLSINGISCTVTSLNQVSISFNYPIIQNGIYDLLLNIGGLDYKTSVKIVNAPVPTLSNTYSWKNGDILVLTGTNFGYVEPNLNLVLINGQPFTPTIATAVSPGLYQLTFDTNSATASITEGTLFTAQVVVQSQASKIVNFNLIKSISMSTKNLYTIGGLTTFSGSFGTTNTSIVSLSIFSIECTVTSISKTSISFNYPGISNTGSYTLNINIGGLLYTTIARYIATPAPTLVKYYWKQVNNVNVMVLIGTTFSYTSTNLVTINGINIYGSVATASLTPGYDEITLFDQTTLGYSNGDSLAISVKVGTQTSNVVNFCLVQPISFVEPVLFTLGSVSTSLSGVFTTQNKSAVTFSIGGVPIQVNSMTSTLINFSYPMKTAGNYDFSLNICGLDYSGSIKQISYVAAPPPTVSNKYSFIKILTQNVLIITGTSFGYYTPSQNSVSINGGQSTVTSIASASPILGYDQITILDSSVTSSLTLGSLFSVVVTVQGQTSNTVYFNYINPISMITQDLYTIGGSITFGGDFSTSNTSIVTLSIGSIECEVTSISSTSITFTYPMLTVGDYDVLLNIGGLDMSTTQVTVIKSPEPTLLSKYSWATIGNVNVMVLTGTSFGYYEPNPNSVLINGESNVASIATASSTPGYDQITINENALSSLTAGDLFTIEVKVLDQTSDAVNLNLIYPISMTTKQLYTLGGSITFNGVFSTSDKELALLSIDGDACTIVELTPTTISFTYPSFVIGDYDLYLEIGCVDYSSTVTYIKPPPPTLLNNYSWRTLIGGENVLVLTGTGFNYQDVSSVLINGVSFESTIAVASSKAGYDEITFEDDTATNSFTEDELFTVVVDVDSQQSNLVNFNFIKLISVNSVTLNTTGGDVSFTGVYGTSNKSIVSLSINNIECTINSINPTTITFTYPAITNAGEYNYNLNIGGLSYSSIVKYVVPVTPTDTPTVTPTTPTTTSPTTTSSSDDQPSNSIRLSISFILSTLTFSLLLLIL